MSSTDNNMAPDRDKWSSSLGFIMAAAGSAVGLGNLWRFPFLVGQNGGSAFIIIYLLFLFFIGISLVISEISVGRFGQLNPVDSYSLISPKLKWVGYIGIFTGFVLMSFYPVVGGWILFYLAKSFQGISSNPDFANLFNEYTSHPYLPIVTLFIFSFMNYLIIAVGVEKGIEKYSKIMMPALIIILVIVALRTLTLDKGTEGLVFLLKPDFSKVTTETIFEAMGQVFFSLSLGMGALMTYGSYLGKEKNILKTAISIPIIDTSVALLAAVAIMPAVFALGFKPDQGPSLIFITLPAVFKEMPMGNFVAILFFLLMLFAALTSSISMLEGLTAYITDRWHFKRIVVTSVVSFLVFLLGIPCALSFGTLEHIKLFPNKSIFDSFDFLASNILLPFGGFMLCICIGWIWDGGLRKAKQIVLENSDSNKESNSEEKPDNVDAKKSIHGYVFNNCIKEITNNGKVSFPLLPVWVFLIKWICPAVILAIFIYNLIPKDLLKELIK